MCPQVAHWLCSSNPLARVYRVHNKWQVEPDKQCTLSKEEKGFLSKKQTKNKKQKKKKRRRRSKELSSDTNKVGEKEGAWESVLTRQSPMMWPHPGRSQHPHSSPSPAYTHIMPESRHSVWEPPIVSQRFYSHGPVRRASRKNTLLPFKPILVTVAEGLDLPISCP